MRAHAALLFAAVLVLSAGAPVADSDGQPSAGAVGQRLQSAQERLRSAGQRSVLLTTEVSGLNARLRVAQGAVVRTRRQSATARVAEEAAAAELVRLDDRLFVERQRLARLRVRLAGARRVLSTRLVAAYQADEPDVLSVLLNADGFEQLLDETAFLHRVARQDRRIIDAVRNARRDAAAQTDRLTGLQRRQRVVLARLTRERRRVATLAATAETARATLAASRDARRARLRAVRVSRAQLADEVGDLRRQQARVQRQLAAVPARNATPSTWPPTPAGPVPATGGGGAGWRWPVQGPITSPFCQRRSYEACHPGLDIAAPEGTPIRAAAAGRVVLMQPTSSSGGYGNYTCVQHSASVSSCYAHQSGFATSIGAAVSAGQVIGYVGNTGNSRGAHLHWEVRVNGAVTNPLNYV